MASNFEKMNYPYKSDKSKLDLRSDAQKASDYINFLAREAGAEHEKFVQNALRIVMAFSHNYLLIKRQVNMVEQRLAKKIEQRRRSESSLPGAEVFKNGVINIGTVLGSNIISKLRIEYLSGNLSIYGQYGMGKTNLNLCIVPQIISQGIHVDIFDVTSDYRDILQIPGCKNGLVLNPNSDLFNPLEPIGNPEEHLQFLWEITQQDFNLRYETKEMLFNYSDQLYRKFGVYEGNNPPSFMDLKEFLKEERTKPKTTVADKKKIETALRKIDYILNSFKSMANCRKGYALDTLDHFSFVSYEIGNLSEDKRSWLIKLKARSYQHKGMISKERHKVNRIIVVDEAKGVFGKSRIGIETNYIKDMYTKSRSIGCWWIISDQFATELADFTRAASCQISFQHTIPKEIREISTGMGCSEAQKLEIPRLGRYKALQKITDFPFPYPIMTYKSKVQRHIVDSELNRLMRDKLSILNSNSRSEQGTKKVRLITKKEKEEITKSLIQIRKNPLDDFEGFLRFTNDNPDTKLTDIYKALNLSGRKGDAIKSKAKDNELIIENKIRCPGRRGRPVIVLKLTQKGREYISEK